MIKKLGKKCTYILAVGVTGISSVLGICSLSTACGGKGKDSETTISFGNVAELNTIIDNVNINKIKDNSTENFSSYQPDNREMCEWATKRTTHDMLRYVLCGIAKDVVNGNGEGEGSGKIKFSTVNREMSFDLKWDDGEGNESEWKYVHNGFDFSYLGWYDGNGGGMEKGIDYAFNDDEKQVWWIENGVNLLNIFPNVDFPKSGW